MARTGREWIERLQSPKAGESHYAFVRLGSLKPGDEHMIPDLLGALGNPDTRVRLICGAGLGMLGAASSAAIPRLIELLDDPEPGIRSMSVRALRIIGVDLDRVAAALVEHLRKGEPDPFARAAIMRELGGMGEEARPAAGALAEGLSDPDDSVRWYAAVSLRNLGRIAADAAPAIRQFMARNLGSEVCDELVAALDGMT